MKSILVTCYVNPDLDGVAGSIAYAEFLQKTGRDAVAGIMGTPHDEAKYVLDRFKLSYPISIQDSKGFEQIILVDTSDLNGLEGKVDPEKVVEIIDHRKINGADKFFNAKVQIELVGAAVTLVAEKFIEHNIEISKESAILLAAGIISNTLNFKGGVTTDRDRRAYEWLNYVAELSENFWKELFTEKSDLTGSKLVERIDGDFAWFEFGCKRLGIAQIEMIGAQQLIDTRGAEIVKRLAEIKTERNLDYVFQNTIELEGQKNYFVSDDEQTKLLLEKVLNIRFTGILAERPNLIMRKQIVPLLKDTLGEHV